VRSERRYRAIFARLGNELLVPSTRRYRSRYSTAWSSCKCSLAFMHPLSFGGRSEVFGNRKAGPSRHDIILQQIEHGENSSELYTLMPFVVMTPPEMPTININKSQVQPRTGKRVGFPVVSAQHTINITHLVGLAWAGLVLIRPYPQARRG
jgi:hypothetical protein